VLDGVIGGLLVAAWPLTMAGLWAYVAAWASWWPPRRLAVAAVLCVPMVAAFAVARGLGGRGGGARPGVGPGLGCAGGG
jgi:hypothetical protein